MQQHLHDFASEIWEKVSFRSTQNEIVPQWSQRCCSTFDLNYSAGMSQFYMGMSDGRWPNPGYVEHLPFFELNLRSPLPRPSVLKKWRESVHDSLQTAFVVPYLKEVRAANPTWSKKDAMASIQDWALESAEALKANFLVVHTRGEITTGQRDRDELAFYFESLLKSSPAPADITQINPSEQSEPSSQPPSFNMVWIPSGLWEPAQALQQAKRMGTLLGFDPTVEDFQPAMFLEEEIVYANVRALGTRSRLSDETLFQIIQNLAACGSEKIFVSIQSQKSFRDATRLRALLEEIS